MNETKRVLKNFDGIDIGNLEQNIEVKDLAENEEFVRENRISAIEYHARNVGKRIKNYTMLTAEQKATMENAIANEIHVKVDFNFHGYWETKSEIAMLTSVNSIKE